MTFTMGFSNVPNAVLTVDGVVLEKTIDDEQTVPAGTVLLRIGCLSDLEVEADVLSRDATRIRQQAAVSIIGFLGGGAARLPGPFTRGGVKR